MIWHFILPVLDYKEIWNKDNVIKIVKGNSIRKLKEVRVVNVGGRKRVGYFKPNIEKIDKDYMNKYWTGFLG